MILLKRNRNKFCKECTSYKSKIKILYYHPKSFFSDKQYAKTPLIFHNDNYDHCMLRGDEALYCLVTYELKPVDPSNISYIWKTIEVNIFFRNIIFKFF